jgi:DNA-binding NarL/FixJ family response regulator
VTNETIGLRVLLVDPDDAVRGAVRALLEEDGRFVVCGEATDAVGAVSVALAEQPDVCVLEVDMPGTGLAAAWELTSRLPLCDVVILTTSESRHDLMAALRVGVSGYLVKDQDLTRLPHAIWDIHGGTFTMPRRLMSRVVMELRATEPRRRAVLTSRNDRLTSREWEVLDLLARGLSTREAAERLSLSPTAIRVHTASVVKKLGARDRADALATFSGRRAATSGV